MRWRKTFTALLGSQGNRDFVRLLLITIVIGIAMTYATKGKFLSLRNINSMFVVMPELGILSLGIMLAMIVGGIDLSIVAIANLSGVISAKLMLQVHNPFVNVCLGIAVILAVGVACGYLNGFFIAQIGVHPILITLGTYQLYQGLAIVISKGYAIVNFSDVLTNFTNGSLFNLIPYNFLVFMLLVWAVSFVLKQTRFGQSIYLIGANYKASLFSALNSDAFVHITYVIIGAIGSLAGLIMAAKTNSAKADYGGSYTLQAILICLLGGVNWSGGVGKPAGVVIALFALLFLNSGFLLMRYSNFFLVFSSGAFLLFVLIFQYYMNRYDARKLMR